MGVKDLKAWALKMLDSSGKIPDGVLEGTLVAMGSYNECVNIVARDDGQEREYFRGQYCALDVKPFLPPKPKKYNPQHMFRNISQVLPILKRPPHRTVRFNGHHLRGSHFGCLHRRRCQLPVDRRHRRECRHLLLANRKRNWCRHYVLPHGRDHFARGKSCPAGFSITVVAGSLLTNTEPTAPAAEEGSRSAAVAAPVDDDDPADGPSSNESPPRAPTPAPAADGTWGLIQRISPLLLAAAEDAQACQPEGYTQNKPQEGDAVTDGVRRVRVNFRRNVVAADVTRGADLAPLLEVCDIGDVAVRPKALHSNSCVGVIHGVNTSFDARTVRENLEAPVAVLSCSRSGASVTVTFVGSVVPTNVRLFKQLRAVRARLPRPLQCDRCGVFGHAGATCFRDVRCLRCGESHATGDCPAEKPRCINCGGRHPSTEQSCPERQRQRKAAVLLSSSQRPLSRKKALELAGAAPTEPRTAAPSTSARSPQGRSYSDALRGRNTQTAAAEPSRGPPTALNDDPRDALIDALAAALRALLVQCPAIDGNKTRDAMRLVFLGRLPQQSSTRVKRRLAGEIHNGHLLTCLFQTLELDTSLAYMYFLKFRIGICVPSTCSLADVRSLGSYFGKQMKTNVTVPWCEVKQKVVLPDYYVAILGLLLMFVCYGKIQQDKGRFDFLMYYIHRYIRLTPPFLMVSLMLILGPPWMNGPIWHETVDRFAEGCKRYWWTNVIYISSWMKTQEVCLPHGWYLSCDMQYFIIAPIFFIALYRRPALGLGLIGAFAVASMVVTGLVTYTYDYGPVALFSIPDDENLNAFLNDIAFRPYTHFPSFAVGLFLGYLIYKYRQIKISRRIQLVGWLSSVTTGLTLVYGVYEWNAYSPPGPLLSVLYGATSRPAWTLCVAWVTFACVSGHGGFVDTLLSWKAFVPLSKMTFMVYLLHPPLMFMYAAHTMNAIYVTQFMVVYVYFAHLLACYMAAFVGCVTCETPFINVEKILFKALNDYRQSRNAEASSARTARLQPARTTGGAAAAIDGWAHAVPESAAAATVSRLSECARGDSCRL
ncbi:uncharacterized protein [Dermacentor andersoni]|uniref:uncharacterized protein n=1 Tax=Dermacentor andersoni TaxID=34620 RepID=UPI003B3B8496